MKPTMNNLTRICLIRHGETNWNAERRMQGHTDIELNQRGKEQAAQLALALKKSGLYFDLLYTSDLQRAVDTGKAVAQALNLKTIAIPDLRERHYGALQGVKIDEAPLLQPSIWKAYKERYPDHELDGGESVMQFANRVSDALNNLKKQHQGKTIMVVAHGGVLETIHRLISKQSLLAERTVSVPNASLNWIYHNGDEWKIDCWADISHLNSAALNHLEN